jgi:hypothetical protein
MTPEEYKDGLSRIESEYRLAKQSLAVQYAKENNLVTIGDIVTDHIGALKVEKITYYFSNDIPQCVYHGKRLSKKLEPIKRGDHSPAYQSNLK